MNLRTSFIAVGFPVSLSLLAFAPVSADYQTVWTHPLNIPPGALFPSVIGDIDADNQLEIVALGPGSGGPNLEIRDLLTGNLEWYKELQVGADISLIDIDNDGSPEIFNYEVGANFCALIDFISGTPAPQPGVSPQGNSLRQAYPNPFGSETQIPFSLSKTGNAELKIYDIRGRLVRSLSVQGSPAGPSEILWDGLDQSGMRLGSGAYFYELWIDGVSLGSRKVVSLN